MEHFTSEFIECCISLVQSSEDLKNEEVMYKHKKAIEKKRLLVQKLKIVRGMILEFF